MVVTMPGYNQILATVDNMIPTRDAGTLGKYLGVMSSAARQIPAVITLYIFNDDSRFTISAML
ncbi:hypothetical protein D3C77_343220 [compost metagenome]